MSKDSLRQPLTTSMNPGTMESFLDSIIENIPDMIFVKEAKELRFIRFNRAGEELLGYSREELMGKNDYDFFPKEEADFFVARDREVLRSGGVLDVPEESIHTRNKGKRILHTKKIPIFGVDGVPLYLLGISEDITDRRRAEQAEADLHRSRNLEAMGRLAGGVAHDFNNLLTGILGMAEDLARRPEIPASTKEDLADVERAGRGAVALTRQLLAFGRQLTVDPKVLILNDVIEGFRSLLERVVGANITLNLRCDPALSPCRIDAGQIEQILLNAVLNSRDAMPGGGAVTIETHNVVAKPIDHQRFAQVPEGGFVALTITDTGTGMDRETLARAFEPFFSTKPGDRGSGLGLASIYGIVKQNGGDALLESSPGEGTTLRVYFPRTSEPIETSAPLVTGFLSGHETILVVEDNKLVRRTVTDSLKRAGYQVLDAEDGVSALEIARTHAEPIHLLLTDVIMPGLNGCQLAKKFLQERPQGRILYMSGYAQDIMGDQETTSPEAPFLSKGFTSTELCQHVRQVLNRTENS